MGAKHLFVLLSFFFAALIWKILWRACCCYQVSDDIWSIRFFLEVNWQCADCFGHPAFAEHAITSNNLWKTNYNIRRTSNNLWKTNADTFLTNNVGKISRVNVHFEELHFAVLFWLLSGWRKDYFLNSFILCGQDDSYWRKMIIFAEK